LKGHQLQKKKISKYFFSNFPFSYFFKEKNFDKKKLVENVIKSDPKKFSRNYFFRNSEEISLIMKLFLHNFSVKNTSFVIKNLISGVFAQVLIYV